MRYVAPNRDAGNPLVVHCQGIWQRAVIFLGAASLFNCGCVFSFSCSISICWTVVFREDVLGNVAAAASIGGLIGTLPAGIFAQRFGLRRSLLFCMTLVPALFCLRALATSQQLQIGLGFVGGLALSMWAVCIPPAMARLTKRAEPPIRL